MTKIAKPYLIKSDIERDFDTDEPLYWSNKNGWVLKRRATKFSKAERSRVDLPMGGHWYTAATHTGPVKAPKRKPVDRRSPQRIYEAWAAKAGGAFKYQRKHLGDGYRAGVENIEQALLEAAAEVDQGEYTGFYPDGCEEWLSAVREQAFSSEANARGYDGHILEEHPDDPAYYGAYTSGLSEGADHYMPVLKWRHCDDPIWGEPAPSQEEINENATIGWSGDAVELHVGRKRIGRYREGDTYTNPVTGRKANHGDPWKRALKALREWCTENNWTPNLYSVNDHGNVDLLNPKTGKIIKSWV